MKEHQLSDYDDIWVQWPLSVVEPRPPEAIALRLPIGAALPSHFDDAIRQCSIKKTMVCVVWTAPTYVVLERIEPVTDDVEKADMNAMGRPWQLAVHQAFDVIPTADVNSWDDDVVHGWYENLRAIATEKALRHFEAKKELPLFVDNDSISNKLPSSVLLSVGGIAWVHTRQNRKSVMEWTESAYAQLVSATLLSVGRQTPTYQ